MKIIGLCVVLLVIAFLFYRTYGAKEPAVGGPTEAATLGAPPPSNVASNARAAREYTQRQMCLASCAAEERNCGAMAAEQPAVEACGQARRDCEAKCPSDAP